MSALAHNSLDLGLHPLPSAVLKGLGAKPRALEAGWTLARDPDLFGREVAQHRADLVSLGTRLAGSRADGEDLAGWTIRRALERKDQFTEGTHLWAWLARILKNGFYDWMRAKKRRPTVSIDEVEPSADPPEPQPDWMGLDVGDVLEALDEIPEPFALVFRLHHIEGQSYAHIAERTGLKPNTVATRLFRARMALRKVLQNRLREREGRAQ